MVTQNRLAVAIGVPPRRNNEIVHGKRRNTADTALRLGRYFGTTAQFWINLQSHHHLEIEADALGKVLDGIRPLQTAWPAQSPIEDVRQFAVHLPDGTHSH